jgi:hypothetical protein
MGQEGQEGQDGQGNFLLQKIVCWIEGFSPAIYRKANKKIS